MAEEKIGLSWEAFWIMMLLFFALGVSTSFFLFHTENDMAEEDSSTITPVDDTPTGDFPTPDDEPDESVYVDVQGVASWGYWSISDAIAALSDRHVSEYNSFFCDGQGIRIPELENYNRRGTVRNTMVIRESEGIPILLFTRVRFNERRRVTIVNPTYVNYYFYVTNIEGRNCIERMGLASEIASDGVNEPIAPRPVEWGQWILLDRIHDSTMAKSVVDSHVGGLFNARIVPDNACEDCNVVLGPFDLREQALDTLRMIENVNNMHFFELRNINDSTLYSFRW